jgi:hypothetical protein
MYKIDLIWEAVRGKEWKLKNTVETYTTKISGGMFYVCLTYKTGLPKRYFIPVAHLTHFEVIECAKDEGES